MNTTLRDLLEKIIAIPSPSGYDREIIPFILEHIKDLGIKASLTNKGAILAEIPGKSKEAIVFSAHVDTLGAMVKEIKSNGRLKVTMIGGCPWISLDAENCVVRTSEGHLLSGTFQGTLPSVHIDGAKVASTERNQDSTELVLDEKVSSQAETEGLGVSVGDFIFIDPRFTATSSGFIKSRYLDDKASVAILLEAMATLKEADLPNTIHFLITTYEEVGHGASAGTPHEAREFIAVDMGAPGNGQNSSEYAVSICAMDSTGPFDLEIRERLVTLCKENEIPYKVDIYNYYGSDATAAQRSGSDIRTGLIGPGVFASHAYERTHLDSMEAALRLVVEYAKAGLSIH